MNTFPAMNLPPEATPWGREMQNRVAGMEREIQRLQSSTENSLRMMAATLNAIPIVVVNSGRASNFSLTNQWQTIATTQIDVPVGKQVARVVAVGGLAAVDATSGGVTTAYGRIVIGDDHIVSPSFSAAKDAGASVVNNVITPSFGTTIQVDDRTSIPVEIQAYGENGAAFPVFASNYAQITAIATFL